MLSAGRSVSEDQEHVKRSSCLDRLTATQHSLSSELDKDHKGIFAIQYKTFLMAYHFWNLILMRCSAQRRVEYTGGRGALKLNILILHWCTNIEYTGGCDALMICPVGIAHRNEGLNVLEDMVDVVDGEAQRLGHAELPVVVLRRSFGK